MSMILISLLLAFRLRYAAAYVPSAWRIAKPNTVALFATRQIVAPPSVSEGSKDELQGLYNSQVTRELSASQLYLSASIWCDQKELVGMASYMREESAEERQHALAFVDFAMKRGMPLRLETVPAPECDWGAPEELWSDVLASERENTQALLNLADAAQTCHDHSLTTFLMPFHMEQVDSEDKLNTIIAQVRDENKTPGLLRQLDTELGGQAKGA